MTTEQCTNLFEKGDEPWTYRCVLAKGHDGECDPHLRPPPPLEADPSRGTGRGWWNMPCWNGLSSEQQERLIRHGNLEFGYEPAGECPNGAAVAVETEDDSAPGPRFYCRPCAVEYVKDVPEMPHLDLVFWRMMDARLGLERTDEERREAWTWWVGREV